MGGVRYQVTPALLLGCSVSCCAKIRKDGQDWGPESWGKGLGSGAWGQWVWVAQGQGGTVCAGFTSVDQMLILCYAHGGVKPAFP